MTDLMRRPTHPGEILQKEFLEPLGITQSQLAKELNTTFRTINQIVNEKNKGGHRNAADRRHYQAIGLVGKIVMDAVKKIDHPFPPGRGWLIVKDIAMQNIFEPGPLQNTCCHQQWNGKSGESRLEKTVKNES